MIEKYGFHKELCDNLNDTYIKKNKAYGDSFSDTMNRYGLKSASIRLYDKLNRFDTLASDFDIDTFDEPIKDTLLDMANYCLMTVIYLEEQKCEYKVNIGEAYKDEE